MARRYSDLTRERSENTMATPEWKSREMPRAISAADARRQFPTLLKRAAKGETVIITQRGVPVARLVPHEKSPIDADRSLAWKRLLATLEEGLSIDEGILNRDGLYDR
ncbi:type II toxin-antitoxin system Phd/YefM family antitoxin [Skermanella stibiiresistens]|uniref:type II toxin-antitoxin system Phd/YefM family antitoxin n=1 Tax=Skermanella stibiiresistens TaxID=913326 RepID=UPI001FE083C6|nr:type II toxin-antitoxin system prevent-host-death family antitoxin [Skermanella stibiiresistens]